MDKTKKEFRDVALVYLAAGISSRFGGKIKQFARVGPNEETLIEVSLKQALKAGFTKIVFIVGNLTEKPFKEFFKEKFQDIPVYYALQTYDINQRDRPWGTADAICTLINVIDCPFVICNGDDLYGEEPFKILINHLKNNKEEATIGFKLIDVLPESGAVNRAIFSVEDNYVRGLTEKFNIAKSTLEESQTSPNDLCSMNIFALHPKTVFKIREKLNKFKLKHQFDRKIECLLPEQISELIKENEIKMRIYSTNAFWLGVTKPEDEEIVREKLRDLESKTL